MTQTNKDIQSILQTASSILLEALKKQEHGLSKCSKKVKDLMREGVNHARSGMLDLATESFHKAAEIDPEFVGARIQLIKAYQAQDKDLEALVMGGFALSIASDPGSRCRIFNFMGKISQEIFKNTQSRLHLLQSISFYERANLADTNDIIPVWNLVDLYLFAHTEKIDSLNSLPCIEQAKKHFRILLDMTKNSKTNASKYLTSIISDAKTKFSIINEEWFNYQLTELERFSVSTEWQEESNTQTFSLGNMAKAFALATVMSSLANLTYSLPHNLEAPNPEKIHTLSTISSPEDTNFDRQSFQYESTVSLYKLQDDQIESVDHDWGDVKLSSIEHDWGDLDIKTGKNT